MASFADIPVSKFNQLEVKFLCAIQYDLAVAPSDIAVAEKALQMTTKQCSEPVQKKIKVVHVLQDNSNQSSSACGVAASNNFKENEDNSNPSSSAEVAALNNSKDMENSSAEVASNNYGGGCDSNENAILKVDVGQDLSVLDLHINNDSNSPGASPDCWSSSTDTAPKGVLCSGMPDQKMSTPERLGSYTLVATAAE